MIYKSVTKTQWLINLGEFLICFVQLKLAHFSLGNKKTFPITLCSQEAKGILYHWMIFDGEVYDDSVLLPFLLGPPAAVTSLWYHHWFAPLQPSLAQADRPDHWFLMWISFYFNAWFGRFQLHPGQPPVWPECHLWGSSHLSLIMYSTRLWSYYSSQHSPPAS